MGTRCLTVFKEEDGTEIAVMYRQMDGYPSGHGQELADFLAGKALVNGIGADDSKDTAFNGMHCLAASVVAHFKKDLGSVYLYPAGTRDVGEEYTYTVTGRMGEKPTIKTK
ncbi:hypothetical protein LCGC14_2437560 [marine sediment metagenome]|uniref:Uncharacterized protein n=1 Tax=marine sediment metagenome TaxID=412755 RepID=A0A0F9BK68_9ZZZZ